MKNIFLLMVGVFLLSCTKKVERPDNILDEQQMASILTDIHLLENKIDVLNIPADSGIALYKAYEYDLLVNKHKVDTLIYRTSFEYYTKHLKDFHKVYTMVGDSLNKKQTQGF